MRSSEDGFTVIEFLFSTAILLVVLATALSLFSRNQSIYTNERATLDMVQDLRTAFDRFTGEIRMAGAGLPGYHGVVSGTATTLIVRGDYNNSSTIVTSVGPNSGGVFSVGSTTALSANQTISILNTVSGAAALARITAVNATAGTITINSADLLPITSGASVSDFGAGAMINVIERRTYSIKTGDTDPDRGSITRTVVYESTMSAGGTVAAQEIIARNVLTADGAIGLAFTYLDAADNILTTDPTTGFVDASRVAKVQIGINARTAAPDLGNGKYRTVNMTALVQVRGQYIPAVGF